MSLRAVALVALAALAGCSEKAAPPTAGADAVALPRTAAEVKALIASETKRPPRVPDPEVDASTIVRAAEARGLGELPSGQGAIVRWLQAALDAAPGDLYLFVGTWHDAPGHIDAFRRLVGPGGLRGLTLIAAEQFRGDGVWKGVPPEAQRGDGALLSAWSARGDAAAFAALAGRHRESDYAAWKLGYEETALDLLVSARAAGTPIVGCDMPAALQGLSGSEGELRNRLREVHCLRSLPISSPRRVAMIWGQAHVRSSGIARFVPASATVIAIHVVGRRQVAGAVEIGLASRFMMNDPVLIPLGEREAALVLPDETLGGHVDRVLTSIDDGATTTGLMATAEVGGTLAVGSRSFAVGREAVSVPLAAGDHTYAFTAKGCTVLGAARLAVGHRVEISFDPEAKLTTYVERAPR